jgi:hypothetical protein
MRRRRLIVDGVESLVVIDPPALPERLPQEAAQPDGWGWDWERWRRRA